MRDLTGCGKWVAVVIWSVSILAVVSVGIFVAFDNVSRRQKLLRVQYAPPSVVVSQPTSGTSAPAGSHLTVFSIARGAARPIVTVELWMDGVLKATQKSDLAEGHPTFYADFDLLVPAEGSHLLLVRAIDSAGLIGQSPVVGLTATSKSGTIYQAVPVQEGQTLDAIAAANGVQPQVLHDLNPGLGDSPPGGSTVKIPAPPEPQGSEPLPNPAPAVTGNTSIVIPDVGRMQIASDRSAGLLQPGLFIPEPFAANSPPPAAPSGLQAEIKNCTISMRWQDNATDEESYYVYMVPLNYHGFSVPMAYLKPSPKTGPAWYEFQPQVGGSISLWVEAANSYGSRPSNMVWVYIPYVSGCAPTVAHQLDLVFQDMSVEGNFDKAYCYVSFENAPEQRLPWGMGFIQLQGGKTQEPPAYSTFRLTVPYDKKIDLSGDCSAWAGDAYSEIGTFSVSLPQDTWTGVRQTVKGDNFQMGISINPMPAPGTGEIGAETVDPTLSVPYDVHEEPLAGGFQSAFPMHRTLRWKWDGDPTKIDSYEIFLNGQPYVNMLGIINKQEYSVKLPGECGQPVRWQVAVRVGTVISNLSAPFNHELPACQAYLRVRFEDLYLTKTDDGWPGDSCDTLDAYFELSVRDSVRSFWNSQFTMPLKCGDPMFKDITGGPYQKLYGPEPNVITIPLSSGEDLSAIWIKARFWDSDSWNSDDLFASFAEHPLGAYVPLIGERWTSPLIDSECKIGQRTGKSIYDEAESSLGYSYSVYPNTCRDIPPAEGF